jgi:hypothetical protein
MNAIFLDCETTGRNPLKHQVYEFAMVPIIGTLIRRDLMWHTYLTHKTYRIEADIVQHVASRLANPKPGVPAMPANQWGRHFKQKIRHWFGEDQKKIVVGGKNVGSFDWQFMCQLDQSLRIPSEMFSYSYADVGPLYHEPDDDRLPSLAKCRERALLDGAPLSRDNTHYADDDALLAAELWSWGTLSRIYYGEVTDDTIRIIPAQHEIMEHGEPDEEGDRAAG